MTDVTYFVVMNQTTFSDIAKCADDALARGESFDEFTSLLKERLKTDPTLTVTKLIERTGATAVKLMYHSPIYQIKDGRVSRTDL
jgi:hypothetical protein